MQLFSSIYRVKYLFVLIISVHVLTITFALLSCLIFHLCQILAVGADPLLNRIDMNGAILSQIHCAPPSAFSISLHPSGVCLKLNLSFVICYKLHILLRLLTCQLNFCFSSFLFLPSWFNLNVCNLCVSGYGSRRLWVSCGCYLAIWKPHVHISLPKCLTRVCR